MKVVEKNNGGSGFDVAITGKFAFDHDLGTVSQSDLQNGELRLGLPAALIILVIVFCTLAARLIAASARESRRHRLPRLDHTSPCRTIGVPSGRPGPTRAPPPSCILGARGMRSERESSINGSISTARPTRSKSI